MVLTRNHKKVIAITLLAGLLINYPWLALFSKNTFVFGIPILYVYLFGIWAVLILCVRKFVDRHPQDKKHTNPLSESLNQTKRNAPK